jgi:hypothetical protein
MLTLAATLRIPAHVLFTTVAQEAVLLNTVTNKYYSLNEVGARVWNLLAEGKILKEAHTALLEEFEVDSPQLEQDILELVQHLRENGLIDVIEA